ncbi:hypothetical protein NM688_g8911 [Phlebia brevispora]|uniref:Uncharacterized protein n=1 Tax=Phlebia brevispora TaxID=194682 RepID=A0ACC1RNK9_9APHY|nr:hypothetical protein NM688_g8911 [Phlebia brevispora]
MSEANFEAVFPHLQTICRERQERGMEYRVRLTKCYGVAQHQIDELRQLVPVAWDAQDLCVPKSQYDREDEAVNADLYAEQLIKAVTEAERGQMDV